MTGVAKKLKELIPGVKALGLLFLICYDYYII